MRWNRSSAASFCFLLFPWAWDSSRKNWVSSSNNFHILSTHFRSDSHQHLQYCTSFVATLSGSASLTSDSNFVTFFALILNILNIASTRFSTNTGSFLTAAFVQRTSLYTTLCCIKAFGFHLVLTLEATLFLPSCITLAPSAVKHVTLSVGISMAAHKQSSEVA